MDLTGAQSQPQKIAQGHDALWSPDSHRLAFIGAGPDKGPPQLYVVSAAGGMPKQITHLVGALAEPRWSPDGKSLGFLFVENASRQPGPTSSIPPAMGVIGDRGFAQRFAVVDIDSGRVRVVSPPHLYVYEYDWSPDGKQIAATAAPVPGDDNWFVAELHKFNVDTGEAQSLLKPAMQMGGPRWSPDGKQIAFIGGLMSGLQGLNGDVYLISAGGGAAHDVTPQMKASARGIFWLSSHRLLFAGFVHGQKEMAEVDITTGGIKQLWTGAEFSPEAGSFTNFSLASDGRTSALDLQSAQCAPEIWAGPIHAWKQITHCNQDVLPTWGKVESLDWKSDGWTIQGWLYYPHNYDLRKQYPLVVNVHGGPAWLQSQGWGGAAAALATQGYFVLRPNPRGSAGEGEEFEQANVKDFGYGDLRDIVAGVNKVVETLPVDRNRIGIFGWSYGGYMAMWAVTQTHLFHAAVAGAGIANWLSYAGEADIPQWTIPYFGASVYDDPLIYARSSPMTYIKKVKTPTLILVGAGDGECPAPQSQEFWHALRTLGVDSELVIYPDEGHDISKAEDSRDISRRTLEWFNKYLK